MLFTNGENSIIISMPNQLNNARRIIFHRDTIPFSQLQFEFDKNANSDSVVVKIILFRRVGLATIGVCVFCATTSVVALFIFIDRKEGKTYGVDTWIFSIIGNLGLC